MEPSHADPMNSQDIPQPTDSLATVQEPKDALQEESLSAWIQCAAGWCIFFNTTGLLNSFGTFQSYYRTNILFNNSESSISWIGTVQSSFIMFGAVYSGPLYDLGYLRTLITLGSVCLVSGMFITSLCAEYWQFFLAQGLLMGIGLGCLFMPATGILATWFSKHKGIAMGIATSGSALGGIIYPIIFNKLVNQIGFGWICRVMAFIMLSLTALPVLCMDYKEKPNVVHRFFRKDLLKEADFMFFAMATFLGFLGLYIPSFYIQIYAAEHSVRENLVVYLLAIMNSGGVLGRIIIGGLADRIGPLNTFIFTGSACTLLIFSWLEISNERGIIVFSLLYGFFSAGLMALPPTVVAIAMCPDMRDYPIRMIMLMVPIAVGLLIGTPIAGAIQTYGWAASKEFSAIAVLLCTTISFIARMVKVGIRVCKV